MKKRHRFQKVKRNEEKAGGRRQSRAKTFVDENVNGILQISSSLCLCCLVSLFSNSLRPSRRLVNEKYILYSVINGTRIPSTMIAIQLDIQKYHPTPLVFLSHRQRRMYKSIVTSYRFLKFSFSIVGTNPLRTHILWRKVICQKDLK